MDPLSIVASAIALLQAGDRVGGLLSSIETFANAPKEIAELVHEVSNIRSALLGLQWRVSTPGVALLENQGSLPQLLEVCFIHVAEIQSLVDISLSRRRNSEPSDGESVMKDTNRVTWMRKRGKIGRTKRQLKKTLSLIQFELLSMNFTNQIQMTSAVENIGNLFHSLQCGTTFEESLNLRIDEFDSKIENSVRNYHQEFSESTTLDPNTKDVSDGLLPRPDANSAVLAVNSLDESKVEGRIPGVCQHKCFQHTVLSMSILDGLLGWLSLEKSVPDSRCQSCSRKNFRGSLPSLLLTYYTPWWIGHVACAIGLQANPRTSVSIYFPSLLPPDAEVFACIRSGNVERLKTLFVEQRASVADVLGPYGVSTISLAVFYGQTEVYELLHSAGADRISSMLTRSTVADVFNFWSSYSTLDYSISASDALRDHAFQTSPQHQGRALSRLSVESSLESESLEELLAMVETEIDETDSLGRTSLHFAVYTCSTDAVRILLDRKANPNLLDSVGKTPLQIAATMGWVDGTSLLIAHGTDIEQRYQFDNTILHNVCIQGHEHIVRLLLDAGAEMEATNGVGETCVRHAVFGNHVPVLRLLHERGAAFSSLDDLGCTAFHDSILVNSHDALEFLLGLNLRVDEKYLTTGQTALHLLAENASLPTLQIFLDKAKTGLGALEISARDAKNLTALDYLNCRRDENFKCLFSCLLKKIENVQSERSHSFFRESRVRPCTSVDFDNTEDKDKFEDALEEQPQVMI